MAGCPTAGPGIPHIGAGLSCSIHSGRCECQGLGLQGLQFNFVTPRTLSANLTFQYSLTRTLSAQVSYVLTQAMNLQQGRAEQRHRTSSSGTSTTNESNPAWGQIPFPDFSSNSSYQTTMGNSDYNGLQTKLEQQFSNGLNFLFAYT